MLPLPLSVLCWWCDCFASPVSCWTSSSPQSTFCQRLPRHPQHHSNPAAQRVLGETETSPSQARKPWEQIFVTSSVGNSMPETSTSFFESLETGMRQGKAGSSQGRVSSTLSPAHIIVLCSTSTIVWAKPRASALTLNFLLAVGSIPGTVVWNTALIMELAEKSSLLCGYMGYWAAKRHAQYLPGSGLAEPDFCSERSCCHSSHMITTSVCGSPRSSSWLVQLGWLLSRDCLNHELYNVSHPDLQRIWLYRTGSCSTKLLPSPLTPALLLTKSRMLPESLSWAPGSDHMPSASSQTMLYMSWSAWERPGRRGGNQRSSNVCGKSDCCVYLGVMLLIPQDLAKGRDPRIQKN